VNDTPLPSADVAVTAEDTSVDIDVLVNDTGLGDGGISVSVVPGTLTASEGSAVIDADQSIVLTPAPNRTATITFRYQVTDANGDTATGVVSVTITAANDVPVASDDTATTAEDTTVSVNVLTNDTDVDGDDLSVVLVGLPGHGVAVPNAGGGIDYTPDADYTGSDEFTYTISDGHGGTDTAVVNVTVTNINDAPVAVDDTAPTAEETPVTIDVAANDTDVDGNTLTVTAVDDGAHGTTTVEADGQVNYLPELNFFGTDSFTYTVSDGHGATTTATVTVNVDNVNDAPVASNAGVTMAEDGVYAGSVSATDPDGPGDVLTYAEVTPPAHGNLTLAATGSFVYTPDENWSGADSFTFKANDGTADSNPATVTITVAAVNDAPVATAGTLSATEDTAATGTVSGTDADLDDLTFAVVTAPAHGELSAFDAASGAYTYVPDPDYFGADAFTFSANDGTTDSLLPATVTITVAGTPDAPTAQDGSLLVVEDAPTAGALVAFDPDLDPLTYSVVVPPTHGDLNSFDPATGAYTYTPDLEYSGTDSFTFKANDGSADSNVATVSITVSAVDDAPVAQDGSLTVTEDDPDGESGTVVATDAEGAPVTYAVVTPPVHGTLSFDNATGAFTYVPNAEYSGADGFTFSASDGTLTSVPGTVSITVTAVDDEPEATDDIATTDEDTPVVIDVLANDAGLGDPPIDVTIVTVPDHASVLVNLDGTIVYQPDPEFSGQDTFEYRVTDADGDNDAAFVDITVNPLNDNPDALDDAVTTDEENDVFVDVLANDSDADGDALVVVSASDPDHGSATVVGVDVLYSPDPDFHGIDTFTYTISDGLGGSDTATVTVTVTNVNDTPNANADFEWTDEDLAVDVAVLDNDFGLGDTPYSVTIETQAASGLASVNLDGTIHYAPAPDANGTFEFSYRVTDVDGETDTATVSVDVFPVDDLPAANDDAPATDEDVPIVIDVLANDTGLGDGVDNVTVTSPPVSGSAVVNPDRRITFTPAANMSGTVTFTYRVEDVDGQSDTATVMVTVNPVNEPPTVSTIADQSIAEETTTGPLSFTVGDVESAAADLIVTASSSDPALVPNDADHLALGGTGASRTLTVTPAANAHGTATIIVNVSDGEESTDTQFTITVANVNDAPTAADGTLDAVEDGGAQAGDVNATDIDPGETLAYSVVTPSADGAVVFAADGSGNYTFTPAPNFQGTTTFTYQANDGEADSNVATVTITVANVNDAPTARDDSATVAEETPKTIAVLLNDTDVEGDPLSVTGTTPPGNGTVAVNGDGTITYTPAALFNGSDSFTYTISDGHGGSATGTVTVNVTAVNDAPVAVDDFASTTEDNPVSLNVRVNDTDVDDTILTVESVTDPDHGTVTFSPAGMVTYTPDPNYNGPDTFDYVITDGSLDDTGTVTVTVAAVNDPPVANNDSALAAEDGPPVAILVLTNDSDVEGPVSVSSASDPPHGTANVVSGTTVTYTPDPDYSGADNFTYTISDGDGATATATVSVTVAWMDDLVLAFDDEAATGEDAPVTVDVLANDTGKGDGIASVVVVAATLPASEGTAVVNADKTIRFTPAADLHGTVAFDYTVTDADGDNATATVTVTIAPQNDDPVASNDAATTDEDAPVTVDVLANDTGKGDGIASVAVVAATLDAAEGTATVNPDRTITFTPAADLHGTVAFDYTVTDADGDFDTATVTVTITGTNDTPSAVADAVTTAEDTPVTFGVLGNDSGLGDAPVTVTVTSAPSSGTAVANGDNTITYVPAGDFHGTASLGYTVTDVDGQASAATVTVTITSVDDTPAAANDMASTTEDLPVTFGVLGNDSGLGDAPVVVTVTSGPASGTASVNADNSISYSPAANFNGTATLGYTVTDTDGDPATATVTITVNAVNDAPNALDDTVTAQEETAKIVAVLVNDTDVDGPALSITAVSDPPHGAIIDNGDGTVTYTPDAAYNGPDSFTYTVSDGFLSDTATVWVTVESVNDPPVAVDDSATTAEDTAVTITVLDDDSDPDDTLLTVSGVSDPPNGTAVVNPDNTITYTPDLNFSGADTFTYTVSDGQLADTGQVAVTVHAVNDAPVAAAGSNTTDEDTPKSGTLSATDVDDASLSFSVVAQPANGSVIVTDSASGAYTFTPAAHWNGTTSFTFKANDGEVDSVPATITVTVAAVNDAPVAADGLLTVVEDSTGNPGTVSATDIDSADIDFEIVTGPTHGILATFDPETGAFTYTPSGDYFGTDSFTFRATDGTALSNVATVSITVNPVNDAPVAAAGLLSTDEDTPKSGTLSATDVDDASLTFSVVTQPANGSVSVTDPASGAYSFTPAASFHGSTSFTFKANDGEVDSNVATVSITVNPVNDAPVATGGSLSTNEGTAQSGSLSAGDVDGDDVDFEIVGGPSHGALSGFDAETGAFTYAPSGDYFGDDSFTYRATDGTALSNVATVSITVNPVNDAPVANSDLSATAEDSQVSVAVLGNDTDVDGDSLSITGVGAPIHGTAVINGSSIDYTPVLNYSGSDSFTYTISDGNGGTATGTVTVTVNPVNDPPVANNATLTLSEDTSSGATLTASDIESDPLTFAKASDPSHGTVTVNADGTYTYTPQLDYRGPDSFTFRANDGTANSAPGTVSITVNDVNDTPAAASDSASTNEDTAVTVNVVANDSGLGDTPVVVAIVEGNLDAAEGTASASGGSITFMPAPDRTAAVSFDYTVTDLDGQVATATVTVTINPVDDLPVAAPDMATTLEDTLVNIPVLTNDAGLGDGVTVAVIGSTLDAAEGTATVAPDGSIDLVPAENRTSQIKFTYRVTDADGDTSAANVTVNLTPVDDPVVAADDTASTDEDTAVAIPVLANDDVADGGATVTVDLASLPISEGTASVSGGTITLTPAADRTADVVFDYTVTDADGDSDSATVTVTINPVNDTPVATADAASTGEDSSVVVDVLANDTGLGDAPVTVTAPSPVPSGTLAVGADNRITFTPASNFHGTATFNYTVTDVDLQSSTATVTVTVTPANDAPTASDASITTNEDTAKSGTLPAGDVDGDSLTYDVLDGPDNGTLAITNPATGAFTYTPAADYNGPDSFTFKANDGSLDSAPATVSITVNPRDDTPVANPDSASTLEDTPVTINVLANDTGLGDTPLTVTITSGPTGGATAMVNPDNTITVTPALNSTTNKTFRYGITDGNGSTSGTPW
jgi:VCBS repeat-containing protein